MKLSIYGYETLLVMKNFHTIDIADFEDITQGLPLEYENYLGNFIFRYLFNSE